VILTTASSSTGSGRSFPLQPPVPPIVVTVVGTTAVAHYYYSTAAEDREGKRKTTHGRYTDVLVKNDGEWFFIAWRGGADPRFNE